MNSARIFFESHTDAAVVAMMMSGESEPRNEGWSIIAQALDKPSRRLMVKFLRKHSLLPDGISVSGACCEDVFGELQAYVFDRTLTLEALDRAIASYDVERSSLISWLQQTVVWACTDWMKTNHRKQHRRMRLAANKEVEVHAVTESRTPDVADSSDPDSDGRRLDECIHQLRPKQHAALALNIHPFYPMSMESRTVVHSQAMDGGLSKTTTESRIAELEETAGRVFADRREENDDKLQAAWNEVRELRQEIERRESQMLEQGAHESEIQEIRSRAGATTLVQEVDDRYQGKASDSPFYYDCLELERDLVRLRKAEDRRTSAREGGIVLAPSKAIAACLNWTVAKVDMALFRAKKKLKECCQVLGFLESNHAD